MADHGTVEYATAPGNDYPAHEQSYENFIHFTFVGILHIASILFGLTVGGVKGEWLIGGLIIVIAVIGAVPGLASSSRTPSTVTFVLCLLLFAFGVLS